MTIEYWGVESDLVLVLQVFLERRSAQQALRGRRIGASLPVGSAREWLEGFGRRALLLRETASVAAGDLADATRASARRLRLLRALVPADPDSAFDLCRCVSIPVRPHHIEAPVVGREASSVGGVADTGRCVKAVAVAFRRVERIPPVSGLPPGRRGSD